jgi:hypothetical protein
MSKIALILIGSGEAEVGYESKFALPWGASAMDVKGSVPLYGHPFLYPSSGERIILLGRLRTGEVDKES